MKIIDKLGYGVIVIMRSPQKDSVSQSIDFSNKRPKNPDKVIRDYGQGAQILLDLGIKNINLLTNKPKSVIGLDGFDLKITKYIDIK